MALGALALGVAAPALDRDASGAWLDKVPLVFSGRPASARIILSTIAGSMITIGGVVFSMTIVSLQLASSQFGPRLLRTFLRDAGNQIVLGTFVGIYLYCLVVLPSVESREIAFVPRIAVTLAMVQAIVGLGMFVYFIDHVAQSIHADAVIEVVGRELDAVVDTLYPESVGRPARDEDAEDVSLPSTAPAIIRAPGAGYLRFVKAEWLLEIADENDLMIRLDVGVGEHVCVDDQLASI
jgi:uncharacterized membrane protein